MTELHELKRKKKKKNPETGFGVLSLFLKGTFLLLGQSCVLLPPSFQKLNTNTVC
uniref:Uncharacterized protein n=1 Tax=Anguilla anguilla TaxID=7936 RepID=A0A0E9X0R1_ANGAN